MHVQSLSLKWLGNRLDNSASQKRPVDSCLFLKLKLRDWQSGGDTRYCMILHGYYYCMLLTGVLDDLAVCIFSNPILG